jgi:hypothetical protein
MEPHAGRAGEGLEAWSLPTLPLLEMCLHIQARLGAPEDNQIGHLHRMTARGCFIFDLDQFWNCSRSAARGVQHLAKAKGPEGPFKSYQRR